MNPTAPADAEIASLCGVINASHARLVAIVADALDDQSWAIAGVRSPEHWLTMRAGVSPVHARQVVGVARRRGELPSVMAEFASGQLSLDQVAVVVRYAPAHVEASVAELAVHASVPQLRRALSHYSFDPPAESGHTRQDTTFPTTTSEGPTSAAPNSDSSAATPQAANPQATNGVTATGEPDDTDSANGKATDEVTADGNAANREADNGEAADGKADKGNADNGAAADGNAVTGVTDMDSEVGAQATWNGFALEPDRASAPAELIISHDQWGRLTLRFSAPAGLGALVEAALKEAKDALFQAGRPEVTSADALVEVSQRSLGAVESINRRDAYRTYVHLDAEGAWLTGQPRLPAHLAAKLTCDGILQPVWHTQGKPVNVGRAQRIVPDRTRRLIQDRDRGCRFPGCSSTTHLECHHLTHWANGGLTDTDNLACLCPFHHDTHHDGHFTIKGDANNPTGLTFTTRGGFPIHPGPTFTTPTNPPPPRPATPPQSQTPSPPPPATPYRGPSGETLNLRWVTFHEAREPALV